MRAVHVSNSDLSGGAARAAYRLHRGLLELGVDSRMLVQEKLSDDPWVSGSTTDTQMLIVYLRRIIDKLPLRLLYPAAIDKPMNFTWLPGGGVTKKLSLFNPEIVNLHWIFRGMVAIESLVKIKRPLVWTLHDMAVFTGGCHLDENCGKYRNACGACPLLQSAREQDITRLTWKRKRRIFSRLDLNIVAPSSWIAKCVRESSLLSEFRTMIIPHGLDLKVYRPIQKRSARKLLGLPADKKIILFGALYPGSPNKGFHLLISALQVYHQIYSGGEDILLAIFGASHLVSETDFPFPVVYLGSKKDDETLALVYSAADVMIVPSKQESFGQTVSEALACGTPAIAFTNTGPEDIIDHMENGYLAEAYDPQDLAYGIEWVLADPERWSKLSVNARAKAEKEYGLELQARRYINLYESILHANRTQDDNVVPQKNT